MNRIYVMCDNDEYADAGETLAQRLGVPCITDRNGSGSNDMVLRYDRDGLSLMKDGMIVRADLCSDKRRLEKNRLNAEMIVKAAGIKNLANDPLIMDATAGLGEDSFLLAAAGFRVVMYERDAVIYELLCDGLSRASKDEQLENITERITAIHGDSIEAMRRQDVKPDMIFLDPMFPARNKSGLIKKKFQILQQLESPCEEGEQMLRAAFGTGAKKVIVKRPLKGECLSSEKPDYNIKGRTIRYDCYTR